MMKRMKITILLTVLPLLWLSGCGGNEQGFQRDNMTPVSYEQNANTKTNRKEIYSHLNKDQDENQTLYGQISSQQTDMPSNKYPHTTAVQIQHAKYAFITVDEKGKQKTITLPDNITNQLPNDIQQMTPSEIVKYLPKDIQKLLPKGSEHLTPETIAKLIKDSGVKQNKGGQPATSPKQNAGAKPAPESQPTKPPANNKTETPKEEQTPPADNKQMSQLENKVVELTNQERRKHGLADLKLDVSLSHVARVKSQDMRANNYFSHTSPTYGSPFDMMRDFGISYNAAAENIAQGQRTAEEVVQAWMNSSGHRANILNGTYTHIGVGHDSNGNYWTQMFISK